MMFWLKSIVHSEYFPYIFTVILSVPFLVLLRQFVFAYIKLKNKEIKLLSIKGNSENKNQAYERLTLFLERIKPAFLTKKFSQEIKKEEFVVLCSKAIQEEFEYNFSQQLYMTEQAWSAVLNAKNYTLNLLRETLEGLSNEATLEEYHTVLLLKYIQDGEPISESINFLRKEIILIT